MSTYDLPRLNNFNAVASHYAGIKPMTSKVHTLEQDVRPLGDRRRKFERVKKFSDNCYAYYDGNGGDNIKQHLLYGHVMQMVQKHCEFVMARDRMPTWVDTHS